MHRTFQPGPPARRPGRHHGDLRLRPPLAAMGQGRRVYGRPRVLQSVHPQRAAPGRVVGTSVVRTHPHATATMTPFTAAAHGRRTPRARGTRATRTAMRATSALHMLPYDSALLPPHVLAAHRPPSPPLPSHLLRCRSVLPATLTNHQPAGCATHGTSAATRASSQPSVLSTACARR